LLVQEIVVDALDFSDLGTLADKTETVVDAAGRALHDYLTVIARRGCVRNIVAGSGLRCLSGCKCTLPDTEDIGRHTIFSLTEYLCHRHIAAKL